MTVGKIFGKRMIGFPVRKNIDVDVLKSLKEALLEMFEEGDIDALHDKWFKYGECWNNTRKDRTSDMASMFYMSKPQTVDVAMFSGPLIVISIGTVLAVIAAVLEILYFKFRGRYDPEN